MADNDEPVLVDDLHAHVNPQANYGVVDAPPAIKPAQGFGSPSAPLNPSKQLDFGLDAGAGRAGAATPVTPGPGLGFGGSGAGQVDYNAFIIETVLWVNKVRSTFYFVAGLLVLVGAKVAAVHHASIVSSAAYTLLLSLALNFLRGIVSPKWAERSSWSGSGLSRLAASAATTLVHASSALHDAHLSGINSVKTLQMALGLWLFALLGRAVSGLDLILLAFLLAFTVPVAYTHFKAPIDQAINEVLSQVSSKYNVLDRKAKAGVVLGPLLLLMLALPTHDRLVAGFIFLVYGRVLLKPAELQVIQRRAEPVISTISKYSTQAGNIAAGVADKYSLTPVPSKKKHL